MKYLINGKFKAIRRGDFVKADTKEKEFILDTSDKEGCPALGVLIEIEKANKLEIQAKYKKNKLEYLSQLEEKLGEVKMAEQNDQTQSDKAAALIEEMHKAGKSKEEMIVALITKVGMKVAPASKAIKEQLTKLGAILSNKDRKEQGFAVLTEMKFSPKDASDVLAGVARIKDKVSQTNEKQAMVVIRAYAKEKGIELPKKAKGATNLRMKIFTYMIENPTSTKAQFTKFMEENNRNENAIKRQWEIFEIAKKMAETLSGKTNESAKAAPPAKK